MIINLLSFFGVGVLLSLTPCCLPMLPIMASILMGNKPITGHRAFILVTSFVLSSSLCYAVLGVIGGLTGTFIQSWLQQPLIILPMALLLVVMALIQIDIIPIPLTTNDFIAKIGITRDSILGAGLLGVLSVATMSPCVTPALVGVLTYIGTSGGSVFLGGLYLMLMGIGMGVPLLLMSVVGVHILKKPGRWMIIIKWLSAIILVGMAINMTYGVLI